MSDSYMNHPMLRRHPKKREKSIGEETMVRDLNAYKIPFQREVRFYPARLWKFDFLLTGTNIAIEVEGNIWVGKGHSGGAAIERDMIKYNHAAALNFRVLRFSTGMVKSGEAIKFIQRIKELQAQP